VRREYDVVVAGGGPAGLQFAREVAGRSEHSVAVLEANDALSDNDKSTGGTFDQVVEGYDVPDEVIAAANQEVIFEGPTASETLAIPGYVLDFPAFLDYLGRDAERRGADVITGARVEEPVIEDGAVVGVRYRDGGRRELPARIVVDATGPAAVLTGQLGMFDRETAQRGVGKEYEVEGRYDRDDAMLFSFDHSDAPGGYAWTFPAGDGRFKAGVCWIDDFYAEHGDGRRIDEYVEEWLTGDPRWEADAVRAVHAGEAVSNNSINRRAVDGLVAVGDAVSSINPLFGEGIRPGMESAEMAADATLAALAAGDPSVRRLGAYERRWNTEKGRHWRLQRAVGELLYDFDARQQDRFVRSAGAMSPEQLDRLQRYELRVRDLLELYPFESADLRKLPALLRHV